MVGAGAAAGLLLVFVYVFLFDLSQNKNCSVADGEADQLLSAAREAIRVRYSKTGKPPKRISEFGSLAAYQGECFKVRDLIYAWHDEARHKDVRAPFEARGSSFSPHPPAAIVAEPLHPSLLWAVMTFDWASGNSNIAWFDNELELRTHMGDSNIEWHDSDPDED
jgi:hypothetical protein